MPMAPKRRPDTAAAAEDFGDAVLVVASVSRVQLRLGLHAAPELPAPVPLTDAAEAPALALELHAAAGGGGPAVVPLPPLSPDFSAPVPLVEHKLRYTNGPDVLDCLLNESLELRLVASGSRVVLAAASLDTLQYGLGSSVIEADALPLQPALHNEPFKVMPGSTVSACLRLMRQQGRPATPSVTGTAGAGTAAGTTPAAASVAMPHNSSGGAAAAAAAGAEPTAGAARPLLEPLCLLSAADAAACNVLELTPLSASPLPPKLAAAVHAANGALTCTLGLHLPGSSRALVVQCGGGSLAANEQQLLWHKGCRVHLPPSSVQALKEYVELGQPLLLEVARYLQPPAADTSADPAFASHHALLALSCAAEQLSEPGGVLAAGAAIPLGCMSHMLQQGKVAAAGLPVYTPPPAATGGRGKPAVEAAPTAADPPCAWQAAGSRFMVRLRLARPLFPPWQPPARPLKQLQDVLPPRPPPVPPPQPTALDRFRAKVQQVATELAELQASVAAGSCCSSGENVPPSSQQQQAELLHVLDRSGRSLAVKRELAQLVADVKRQADAEAAATGGGPAAAQQRHNELYVRLTDELRRALAELHRGAAAAAAAAATAAQTQQEQQRESGAAGLARLLQLAGECEEAGDWQRAHTLHQRRMLQESPQAAYEYGVFCIRAKCHIRAELLLRSAMELSPSGLHVPAAAALASLALAHVLGRDALQQGGASSATSAQELAEVLCHELKDCTAAAGEAEGGGADVLAWALLALLYRQQGKAKEGQARSCHQELVRQSKAALAAAASSSSSSDASSDAAGGSSQPRGEDAQIGAAANGYLAAAEVALMLRLPGLAAALLELATVLKDPGDLLATRLKLAAVSVAQQAHDTPRALQLLRELGEAPGSDKVLVQVLLGDVQYEAGNLALAKQHYRRALQRDPAACPPQLRLRLGRCFMASADAAIAADVYTACLLDERPATARAAAWLPLAACASASGGGALAGGRGCASAWLGLGMAHLRLADYRSADLALSEAATADPEHPGVWGRLALLGLLQGRARDADAALTQAQRHGLAEPALLVELAERWQQLGRYGTATSLLAKAAVVQDSAQVRAKLASVLLAAHDYAGCRQQLAAARALQASDADEQLLCSVAAKLQGVWPEL